MSEIKGEVVLQLKGLGKEVHWMKSPLGTALILGLSFLCLIKSYEKEETDLDEAEEIKREIERLKSADSEKKE
jgi:hypothetical protein